MVDINNCYAHTGAVDFSLAPLNTYEDLSLDDIDYLENISENDLLNFTNCDELNYSLLPDTPPETPINNNYTNNNNNNHSINGQGNLSDSPNSYTSDNLSLDSFPTANSPLNIATVATTITPINNTSLSPPSNNNNNSIITNSTITNNQITTVPATIIIPQTNVLHVSSPNSNKATTLATCISPSSLVIPSSIVNHCQPVLSAVDLNGYHPQLNGNSLVYSQSVDNSSISKNNIQPKSVLPSQIYPKLAAQQQKELLKKQTLEARKLRNREAALNSRLKKKEYVDGLEENVKKLTKERDALLVENKLLKVKVKDLESQLCNSKTRLDINGNYDSNKKARISYFAVLFMVCIQVSPYLIPMAPSSSSSSSDMPISNSSSQLTSKQFKMTLPLKASPQKHIGRTLLWDPSDSDDMASSAYMNNKKRASASQRFNASSTLYANVTRSILCRDYYNETESLRLENELRDWLTRFQLEEKQLHPQRRKFKSPSSPPSPSPSNRVQQQKLSKSGKHSSNKRLLFDSKYVPIPRLKMWMQKQKYSDYLSEEFDENNDVSSGGPSSTGGEQPPPPPLYGFDYENLMATVHRRDDTFYYLSYPSKGHLILPPISNRTDVRPRFSFLIPTFHNLSLDESHKNSNLNSSSSSNNNDDSGISPQMFILQIDCQVINTKVTLINNNEEPPSNKTDQLMPTKKKMMKKPTNDNRK